VSSGWKLRNISESQPVVAWTSFELEELEGLKGHDKLLAAECERGHRTPEEDCDCGIPAYLPPQPAPVGNIVGEFKLWGRVLERDADEALQRGIKWDLCDPPMLPYYRAEYAYPHRVWVLGPRGEFLPGASSTDGPLAPGIFDVFAAPLEWIDVLLLERRYRAEEVKVAKWRRLGLHEAAVTEELRQGWKPAEGLHVRWRGFWRWRRPKIVRRLVFDLDSPIEAGLVCYRLIGIANLERGRPVLIYTKA